MAQVSTEAASDTRGPGERMTMAGTIDELDRCGFDEHFTVVDGRLHALGSGDEFAAGQVAVASHYRFEGVSDPDDMAILYALETGTGVRGTLTDAFGVYADPSVGEFMKEVVASRPAPPRTARAV
jgi:hypothetical protein